MLQFKNTTPFAGMIYVLPDADGVDTAFTVVKATFALGEHTSIAEQQVPVALADVYHGEPHTSSIKIPSDLSLTKARTDVLLLGTAYAPRGRTTQMDVSIAVGPLQKAVRVFGNRQWKRSGVGHSASPPEPFETMPLVWERAYGGVDRKGSEVRAEHRNPVGAGYRASDGDKSLDGLPLPNLEDPEQLIGGWKEHPAPACFAPVCGHWEPRRSLAGTFDGKWMETRSPFLPKDFNPGFLQIAPSGLVASRYLEPGTEIEIHGATPAGRLRVRIPPVRIETTYVFDAVPHVVPANLDTVVVQPDDTRLTLVWRSAMRCDKKTLRLNQVEATALKAG